MSLQFALECSNVQCFISQFGRQIVPQCRTRNGKLRPPKPTLLVRGTFSLPWSADRLRQSDSTAATGVIISQRYGGAAPCRHLNTFVQILKSIRCLMGSQCRTSRISSEIESNFLLSITKRAAERNTDWRKPSCITPTPHRMLLQ